MADLTMSACPSISLGIDFDNTIVSYDSVFHRVAMEQKVVPQKVAHTKIAIRDWLRETNREAEWTEMQGYVYGSRMNDAQAYPGVIDFLVWARTKGISVSIISHKTKHPFIGPQYDLHEAANHWIVTFLRDEKGPLVAHDRIYFETTKDAKCNRIASTGSSHFIDDLPEILLADNFPSGVERILFDPDKHHGSISDEAYTVHSWAEIQNHFSI